MTISSQVSVISYQGNGATTNWDYQFLIPTASDLVVTLTLLSDGSETVLDPALYSVGGLGDDAGGTVIYPLTGSPLSSLYNITLQRVLPLVQDTDIVNQSNFYPQVLEDALDYLTMIAQQLDYDNNRALQVPVGYTYDFTDFLADVTATAAAAAAAAVSAASAAAAGGSLIGTSTTSLLIGTGTKVFTTQSGKQFVIGAFVTAVSAANSNNYMNGQVVSYSGTTLTLSIASTGGSGTLTDWNLTVSGARGATGATGPAGAGTGDVVGPGAAVAGHIAIFGAVPTSIADGGVLGTMAAKSSIALADQANLAQSVIVGRAAGAGTGIPQALTTAQATAILDSVVGDAGTGGIKGLVPAPAAGDAAAGKFLKADGTFAVPTIAAGSGLILLTSGTISSPQATLDLVLTGYTSYRGLLFAISNFVPVTDDVTLYMRVSTNGGVSYLATGYQTGLSVLTTVGTVVRSITIGFPFSDDSAGGGVSNVAAEGGVNAQAVLMNQGATTSWPRVTHTGGYYSSNAVVTLTQLFGVLAAAQDTDAVRFLFSSGSIASGKYAIYGYA